ncbi:hypothetical protein UY3_12221 [Chelonia mydas]|uniref:Uncharacterized protein n=1 Tax=Chelonia mydas TaxID=8469 RepID=M7AYM7_CHEMY|nr:hypothetical protein UY3_12221 [Chelonia mydas]
MTVSKTWTFQTLKYNTGTGPSAAEETDRVSHSRRTPTPGGGDLAAQSYREKSGNPKRKEGGNAAATTAAASGARLFVQLKAACGPAQPSGFGHADEDPVSNGGEALGRGETLPITVDATQCIL